MYRAEGNPETAKLVIIAESPAREEMRLGRPLVGPSGSIFQGALERAGILRQDCYITNVFGFMTTKNKGGDIIGRHDEVLWTSKGFTYDGRAIADKMIEEELSKCKANLFLTLGATATMALCGDHRNQILKIRGSIYPAASAPIFGRKVLATLHPAAILHGQPNWRYMFDWDFKRAARELKFPEIVKQPHNFSTSPTTDAAIEWLESARQRFAGKFLAVDIELQNCQVVCIGFGIDGTTAFCVDFYERSEESEARLWKALAELLEDPNVGKIFQNGMFDISFLLSQCDILVRGRIHDTMIAHHIMYPDLPKSMAFMQSIYTNEPYHKDMVKHGGIEKGDG